MSDAVLPPVDRWLVTATLTTRARLSIRTGQDEVRRPTGTEPEPCRPKEGKAAAAVDATINAIELDHRGWPFVPGSAIKGLVRHLAATHDLADRAADIEFLLGGRPRERTPGVETATGGAAEFRNAYLKAAPHFAPPVRGRTAIDRGSRAAAAAMLRHDRAVPPGTAFDLEIIIDRADVKSVKLLRSLLALVDGASPASSLGAGDGRVALHDVKVERWDAAAIQAWLKSDEIDWREAGCIDATKETTVDAPAPKARSASFRIALAIRGHFLVSVATEKAETDESRPDRIPARKSPRDGQYAELPASSLDGALRAQAERIWRTVHGNPPEDWSIVRPPGPLEELFGSRTRKGMLTPGDFQSATEMTPVRVDFVAIDRLSGGARKGAKFAVMAFEAPVLRGELHVCFKRTIAHELTGQQPRKQAAVALSNAAIGLLALTLRDLADGDIALGYGTAKGFGDVAGLSYGCTGGWPELLDAVGDEWLRIVPDENAAAKRAAINRAVQAFVNWRPTEETTVRMETEA